MPTTDYIWEVTTPDGNLHKIKDEEAHEVLDSLGSAAFKNDTDFAVRKVLTNEDLNNVIEPGFYNAGGSQTCTHIPDAVVGYGFGLQVILRAKTSYYTQILYFGSVVYRRQCSSNTWSDWTQDNYTDTTYSGSSTVTLTDTTFSLTKANVTTALGYTPPTTDTNNRKSFYGTCSTAANERNKVVTLSDSTGWELKAGTIVGVKFANTNTYESSTSNPITLNVNGSGAKNIYYGTTHSGAGNTGTNITIYGYANRIIYYMYDGTYWVWLSMSYENDTIPSGYCTTGSSTAGKYVNCHNYQLLDKSYLHVVIANSNTYAGAITLNVNSKGAKTIYINGVASSSTNYTLPAGSYLVYYESNAYYFRTDGKLTGRGIRRIDESSDYYAICSILANDANLNNVTNPGFYNAAGGNNCTNKPSGVDAFGLEVIHTAQGAYYTQILYACGTNTILKRYCTASNTWSSWNTVYDFNSTYKTKLEGIATGAEVNQNAFSNVKVGETTVAADSKTDTLEIVAGSNVTLTPDATNDKITIAATDTNTTYTFVGGTNKFTVTPSGGSAQDVTITPSIANNITGSGTSGYIAKFNGTNTITSGPALGSDTTKYLRNDGTWAVPTNTDTKVTQTATTTNANYEILFSETADNTTRTEGAGKAATLRFNPSKGAIMEGDSTSASGTNSHAEGAYTCASGAGAHAEGGYTTVGDGSIKGTFATGESAHAEGLYTTASGDRSHAEGVMTISSGPQSHAEGSNTTASESGAHAEGNGTIASDYNTHAEGNETTACERYAHAEGSQTCAYGEASHAEGRQTKSLKIGSHAEGLGTTANGQYSHAEGQVTYAAGNYSHAEGQYTTASGENSHAEGSNTCASGKGSHAEGGYTKDGNQGTFAIGENSHAEGYLTSAKGIHSHAEGTSTYAVGTDSHAEGYGTTASGTAAHAEGNTTIASEFESHAEGYKTTASGEDSHAEGNTTIASGAKSHAEGVSTKATGENAHAEGSTTTASGVNSHAAGVGTCAAGTAQTVVGKYNVADTTSLFIIGNGTSSARSNALKVSSAGLVTLGSSGTVTSGNSQAVTGGAVYDALQALPEPMVFKGTLGTGGTITTLPVDGTATVGDTYKVITDGTYASKSAKVGDTFICNSKTSSANTWELIPSGDEPSGTVTSVAVSNGGGLSVTGSPITSSGTITISHSDTSSQATVTNSGRTYIQSVTLDTYGHVTKLTSATETVTNTDRYVNSASFAHDSTNNNVKMTLTRAGSDTATVTGNIPLVSSSTAGVAPKGATVSSQSQSTKFLREDGTWAAPSYTTNSDTLVAQSNTTTSNWRKIVLGAQNDSAAGTAVTAQTDQVYVNPAIEVQPSTGTLRSTNVIATLFGVNTSNGTSGGISLYNGSGNADNYGIYFRKTSNKGVHGYVTGDWATYFTMDNGNNRGWVFRNNGTSTDIASINNTGNAVFNGSVTVGGNTTNTSGCRMVYDSTNECMNLEFVS